MKKNKMPQVGQILYFHMSKFNDLPYEHNQKFNWSEKYNIIDFILSKGYNVMILSKNKTIMIDWKRFQQR